MPWTQKQIEENIQVWDREKWDKFSFYYQELQGWSYRCMYELLWRANDVSQRNGVPMPPIPFPSPKQCETFIDVYAHHGQDLM